MPLATWDRWPPWTSLLSLYAHFGVCHFLARVLAGLCGRWRMKRMLREVPAIRGTVHPLLGVLPEFIKNRYRLHHWRDEATRGFPVSKILGPVWDPAIVLVFVRDPVCLRHVLKDAFDKYTKADTRKDFPLSLLAKWIGPGIFTTQHGPGAADKGALWLHQRKIAASIFTRSNFNDNMCVVFASKAKELCAVLEAGKPTDMQKHFFSFTMDSIMKILFGEESHTLGGEQSVVGTAYDNAHRALLGYMEQARASMSLLQFLPWPFGGVQGIAAWLRGRFSPLNRSFEADVAILRRESTSIIDRCYDDPAKGERKDLLALTLRALEQEKLPRSDATRVLHGMVGNFLIAGRDTTACALSWMFYILATHDHIQAQVVAEVDRCVPAGTVPTLKMLSHSSMPLLHALVYETLRLYPPVPVNIKEAMVDDVLPDGTPVPAGTRVVYFPWGMGRDPAVYQDPEQVRLERWVPFQQPPPHEFPVFQAGPRICLGMDMAILEMKLVTTMLLQQFTFTIAPEEAEKVHYSRTITMSVCNSKDQNSHNLWLTPHRRRVSEAR